MDVFAFQVYLNTQEPCIVYVYKNGHKIHFMQMYYISFLIKYFFIFL